MNKQELIDKLAEVSGLSKSDAGKQVDAVLTHINDALQNDEEVNLPPLGKFKTKQRAARTARNPQTGAAVKVKAKTVVTFKPAKALADAIA